MVSTEGAQENRYQLSLHSTHTGFSLLYPRPNYRCSDRRVFIAVSTLLFIHMCIETVISAIQQVYILVIKYISVEFRYKQQTLYDRIRFDSSEKFLFSLFVSSTLLLLLFLYFLFYHFIISSGCLLIGKRNHLYAKPL